MEPLGSRLLDNTVLGFPEVVGSVLDVLFLFLGGVGGCGCVYIVFRSIQRRGNSSLKTTICLLLHRTLYITKSRTL